jgi:hypothetical protein
MKSIKTKDIFYDDSNIGGACMTGKVMNKKELKLVTDFIAKVKIVEKQHKPLVKNK